MPRNFRFSAPARQQGATLVIALLILVLIMMIGITAVSTSNTQYKLAGNLQFEDGALNNAEIAVAAAESWLAAGTNYANPAFTAAGPNPDVATPQILPRTVDAAVRAARDTRPFTLDWNDTAAADLFSTRVGGNATQRYYIELMSLNNSLAGSSQVVGGQAAAACNKVNTYLVTARGQSSRSASKMVQSYFSVISCAAT